MCEFAYVYIYIKCTMDLPLWARKCSDGVVRVICNHFAVAAEKRVCMVDGLAGLYLCVCLCIYISAYVYVYIYKVTFTLSLWARVCGEFLLRGICNHFAINAYKWPCVVEGLSGLSLCVCVCVCIYI
jgi:hypothetical protein